MKLLFGAMCERIHDQLTSQGFDVRENVFWQNLADSITMLKVQNLITDSQAKSARDKLFKKISAEVRNGRA